MSTTGSIPESSPGEIDEAASKARKAFEEYRNTTPSQKVLFFNRLAQFIDESRPVLIEQASKETSLPAARLDGEITRTVNQVRLFADLVNEGSWVRAIIDTADPDRKPIPKPDLRQMQQPLGPVAVFGASNFPFAFSVAGGDTISALAAGCTVIYKANPGHPVTSLLVADLVTKAAKETGMPDGVFSILHGTDYSISIRLVTHPDVKAVGFTGSFRGGKALFDAAAGRKEPIPVYAEMGSVNPVFILPEILQHKGSELAKALAASNTASVGQFCTNPGIIVSGPSPATTVFLNEFAGCIKETPSSPMLTAGIFNSFGKAVKEVSAKKNVAVMAVANDEREGTPRAHMFHSEAKEFISDQSLWEEIFGPSSIHVTATDTKEMIDVAKALPGQLTVSVWGTENDLDNNKELIQVLELKAGRIIINAVPTGVEVTAAMNHGGPYPATSDSKFTSVGTQAIYRFTRPVCYQNFPETLLPEALRNSNPLQIRRMINSTYTL